MATSKITSSSEHKKIIAKQYFLRGLVSEVLSLILLWTLISIRNSVQQITIIFMSLTLLFFSIITIVQFNHIPNNSVPPEKLIGIIAGVFVFLAGLVILATTII